jgi:flagellar protein FliO/FliZ
MSRRKLSMPLTVGLLWSPAILAQVVGQSVPAISLTDRLQWLLALLVVLGLFFLCIWFLRKLGALNNSVDNRSLRVVSGVSLGMREKVILLQVGHKQLLLAVTPGNIETLAVLEGDDCLPHKFTNTLNKQPPSFAEQLNRILKGSSDV